MDYNSLEEGVKKLVWSTSSIFSHLPLKKGGVHYLLPFITPKFIPKFILWVIA